MFHELSEVKKIRKRLGLTQTELARLANVSQSLLAKLESGRLNPTYNTTVRIFATLEGLAKKGRLAAKDVMNQKIITAKRGEKISEIIQKMKRHGISQLPVMEEAKPVGLVTEGNILARLSENPAKVKGMKAEDIMEDCPPILAPDTGLEVISHLLSSFPLVLISKNGKLMGIVTKADILGHVGKG